MVKTFLSYKISDKAMAWITLNELLIGTYIYTKKKNMVISNFEKVCSSVTEMSKNILEKIPKAKDKYE